MSWSLGAGGYFAWQKLGGDNLPPGFASGNGRIEAVEIDIATKTPGRIQEILFREGDFVTVGQVLARMDTTQLHAQLRQAEAQLRRAIISVDTALAIVVAVQDAHHADPHGTSLGHPRSATAYPVSDWL